MLMKNELLLKYWPILWFGRRNAGHSHVINGCIENGLRNADRLIAQSNRIQSLIFRLFLLIQSARFNVGRIVVAADQRRFAVAAGVARAQNLIVCMILRLKLLRLLLSSSRMKMVLLMLLKLLYALKCVASLLNRSQIVSIQLIDQLLPLNDFG